MSSERKLLENKDPWWGEHIHRYTEVLDSLCGNEIVLDIACGTGYGTAILAEKCSEIIGGDIEVDTILFNQSHYSKPNLKFQQMDGTSLPYEDNYFDVLVSFETIEHTAKYMEMLSEFKRVVKPGGKLYISTPNSLITSPNGIIPNPFHTQEFSLKEFQQIIQSFFPCFKHYGQYYVRYEGQNSIRFNLGRLIETIFYFRAIRKIPMAIQDWVMQKTIAKRMYPTPDDYILTDDKTLIARCETQLAFCVKE
jgi:ubiquinone/menaquinone biosynthesis C-methylase UbiE